ncbi:MAG: DNA-binding transcriptional LysR family regulator [Alteromonadaceae bacterium]
MIKESDLIAILPTGLIHNYLDCGELAIAHPPVDIPHSSISMLWHKRQSADKGLMWLRKQIKQIFIKRRTDQVEKVLGFIDS